MARDRLVEAWAAAEADGRWIDTVGVVHDTAESVLDPMVADTESRTVEARRLIAERCIYGVDMNPLAVELAKLSLWLTTVAKGRPFGFLDHNLRHGDSLLGIDDLDQVIELDMTPRRSDQLRLFGRSIGKAVEEAMSLRRQLRAHPVRDIEDVKAMARLDAKSRRKLELPILIADAFVGYVLAEKKGRALEDSLTTIASLADAAAGGRQDALDTLIRTARRNLSKDEPHELPRKPFHWPLEFPEVFGRDNAGFDAFVGNPPFLGGRRMRSIFGDSFMLALSQIYPGASLNADLCAFFFRRADQLLRMNGCLGLLATKSIAEGDTRRTGLDQIVGSGQASIISARSSFRWPGSAAVVVATVTIRKGLWQNSANLDGEEVHSISTALSTLSEWEEPRQLKENKGKCFQGSVLVGSGFVLSEPEAKSLLANRQENQEVIRKLLGGNDVATHPTQRASRYAIDFRDRSQRDCERRWPELMSRIREQVKPNRDKVNRAAHKKYWWHHGDKRPALYREAEKLDHLFVVSRATKFLAFVRAPARQVFQDTLVVVAMDDWAMFAALQSSAHDVWTRQTSSRLGDTLKYTISSSFETFPFPLGNLLDLYRLGEEYHLARERIQKSLMIGLTQTYNMLHDPSEKNAEICSFRENQVALDRLVAEQYGWKDIALDHGFHEVPYLPENDRMRFTVSEDARREILHRLSDLNRERFREEVDQGLHGDVKPEKKSKPRKPRKASKKAAKQSMGLDLPEPPQPSSSDKKDALLTFLRSRPGRHGRGNLFGVRRMTNAEFSSAVDELISEGLVVRDGTAPNETYMISERGKNG